MCSYTPTLFEWNENKRRSNLCKHRLDFADAHKVFGGYTATREDTRYYGEQRWLTAGLLREDVVIITHTEQQNVIRIISMRKANGNETKNYFESVAD